ncbi:calcium/calmodulin-dependent 3',5'-cyclic nucleotide phosphodiesterase 1A, partial [Cyclospora cayetanensis]|uniref:Calcium/calmodulin-dependent 3',5'-cyclic nucleotide phosphodiesterase 1A n=1 Tax=Cyclospora cayetanensis TaxID=88456 RepID=A0A6P6RVG6_9EIME
RNNNFFVAEMSALSILFNDASVLENFHCSLTFRVLNDSSCNLFALLSDAEAREVRSKIIELILATDMRTHFEFLNRFRTIRGSEQFNFKKNEDDRWLAAELCMRASDIGHGALKWKQHFEWTARATTEFYLQGDEESRLGRTMSPLCDRETHAQLATSQLGFLRHVVRPLFVELDAIEKQKTITDALKNLDDNCEQWEKLGEAEQLIVFPQPVREQEATLQ